jgi:hypothetical protein
MQRRNAQATIERCTFRNEGSTAADIFRQLATISNTIIAYGHAPQRWSYAWTATRP